MMLQVNPCASIGAISTVLLADRNRRDLDDVRGETRGKLKFAWVECVDQAVAEALWGALVILYKK